MKLLYHDPIAGETRSFDLAAAAVKFGRAREENDVALRCRKDPSNPKSEEDGDLSLKISRRHLEIRLLDGRTAVVDRGSKMGTFVGGRRLEPEKPLPLSDGDVIRVCEGLNLRVRLRPGEAELVREEPERPAKDLITPQAARTVSDFSRSLETSILVVMFTDQVGSTKMGDLLGEKAFHKVRRTRDRIQTEIIKRGGAGRTIKSTGDGLLCVFSAPQAALERAIEIQRALAEHNRGAPASEHLLMRIGLDMGQVAIDRQFSFDVFGMHVNRAARVMSHADGGQILMTQAVSDAVRGWVAGPDQTFVPLGSVELKGISEPVALYRLDYA